MNQEQLEGIMDRLQLAAQLAVMTKRAAEAELQLTMVQIAQVKAQLAELAAKTVEEEE